MVHSSARKRLAAFACALVSILASTGVAAATSSATVAFRGAQVHSLWSAVSRSEMTAELNDLQTAGANVLRVDVGWGSLETAQGYYDATYLAKLDALAAEAQARGIKLIPTLWWTPRWASAAGQWNSAPSNPADYGAFAHFITARYGSELAAVEAWNEPNWNNNLVAANVPLAYAGMLKAFYTGAKQGDAGVAVLAGSMAYADLAFLGQLYAYGIKGYYDGISLHPYADGAAPENTSVTHSFQGAIEKLHLFQLANGDSTPEWITEFGWPVGTSAGANTEAQQAEYIEKAFGVLNRLPYVAGGTTYQLRDMGTEPSNPEDNFGLLHQNFTPRPAYAAFTRAMQADLTGVTETIPQPPPPIVTEPAPSPGKTKHNKARNASLVSAYSSSGVDLRLTLRRVHGRLIASGHTRKHAWVSVRLLCPTTAGLATARRVGLRASARGGFRHELGPAGKLRGCEVAAHALARTVVRQVS